MKKRCLLFFIVLFTVFLLPENVMSLFTSDKANESPNTPISLVGTNIFDYLQISKYVASNFSSEYNQVNKHSIPMESLTINKKNTILASFKKMPPEEVLSQYKNTVIVKLRNSSPEKIPVLNKFKIKDRTNDTILLSGVNDHDIRKLKSNPNIEVYPNNPVKIALDQSVPMINAPKVWNERINGSGSKVCIIDTGLDYTHPAFGPCNPKIITYNGEAVDYALESTHPYPTNFVWMWIINKTDENFQNLTIHFANISTEFYFDKVLVADGSGIVTAEYSGNMTDVYTPTITGSVAYIVLLSDTTIADYGFYIDKLINGTIDVTYDWISCPRILNAFNFVSDNTDPFDDNGHGTHVAGIIASNDEIYRGVAPDSKLLIAKTFDKWGFGGVWEIEKAIQWCQDNGAQVMSMSFGSPDETKKIGNCDDTYLAKLVNSKTDEGLLSVVAAGNENDDGVTSPGCASKALTVAAVRKDKIIPWWSSKGTEVDIAAPGVSIMSTIPQLFGGLFTSLSGTSMATPHVTGIASLLLQSKPEAKPIEIKDAIVRSGKPADWCEVFSGSDISLKKCTASDQGSGIVDAFDSLSNLLNEPIPTLSAAKIGKTGPNRRDYINQNELYNLTVNIKFKDSKIVKNVTVYDFYPLNMFEFHSSQDCILLSIGPEKIIQCSVGDITSEKNITYLLKAKGKGKTKLPPAKIEYWVSVNGISFQNFVQSNTKDVYVKPKR